MSKDWSQKGSHTQVILSAGLSRIRRLLRKDTQESSASKATQSSPATPTTTHSSASPSFAERSSGTFWRGRNGLRSRSRRSQSAKTIQRALFGPMSKTSSLGGEELSKLSRWQHRILKVIDHILFKLFMALIVVFNIWLVAFDTDLRAIDEPVPRWVEWTGHGCLLIYILDLSAKIYLERTEAFFNSSNWFDFFIIVSDVAFELLGRVVGDLPSFSILRMVRVLRAVRIMRDFMVFRELYLMMRGLLSALRAIIFATVLIAVVLTMWSILAVELMHKPNQQLANEGTYGGCKRCRDAFVSVGASNLTFLKGIIAGDSWGEVSIPLMEAHPWTAVIILTAFVSIQLGLLNVIVAVIVDRQSSARADDDELVHTLKQEQLSKSYDRLIEIFRIMDVDGSGYLTFPELQSSYDTCADFREMLDVLDIGEEDLQLVFDILDQDRDSHIGFEEFVHQLHALKSRDSHTLLIFIKHYVAEIWSCLETKHGHLLEQVVQQNEQIIKFHNQINDVRGNGCSNQDALCADRSSQCQKTFCNSDEGKTETMESSRQISKELPLSKMDYPRVHHTTLTSELERLHRQLEQHLMTVLSETAHRLSSLSTSSVFEADAMPPSKWESISEFIPSEHIATGTWDISLESKTHHCLPGESFVPYEHEKCGVPWVSHTADARTVSASSWYHVPQAVTVKASQGSGGEAHGPMASDSMAISARSICPQPPLIGNFLSTRVSASSGAELAPEHGPIASATSQVLPTAVMVPDEAEPIMTSCVTPAYDVAYSSKAEPSLIAALSSANLSDAQTSEAQVLLRI